MSDKSTSTLQSVIDQASGLAQQALGAVTGSGADKVQGEDKRAEGEAEDDLSHATAKAGPFTATTSGVTKDHPDRTEGSWNQSVGSGKEAVGNLLGAEDLKQQGIRQNQEGKEQEAAGQLEDFGSGIKDRAAGTVGAGVASITGNTEARAQYEKQHDIGKTQQRSAEADIQKQESY
ncbi:hypothetical protein M501DRAFT_944629 [Patellaria atrata CBS 101060]|uniref:CsbD-like domain-containing protein n=1 Tax=Patellaria atrata CBS 101060 TaxID=1346257 RepID=A0A9P4S2Z5_9PEZI|nr:hypothetical protein M501DRAFT_944629 [Patellaria atrata CBS 101060]